MSITFVTKARLRPPLYIFAKLYNGREFLQSMICSLTHVMKKVASYTPFVDVCNIMHCIVCKTNSAYTCLLNHA